MIDLHIYTITSCYYYFSTFSLWLLWLAVRWTWHKKKVRKRVGTWNHLINCNLIKAISFFLETIWLTAGRLWFKPTTWNIIGNICFTLSLFVVLQNIHFKLIVSYYPGSLCHLFHSFSTCLSSFYLYSSIYPHSDFAADGMITTLLS